VTVLFETGFVNRLSKIKIDEHPKGGEKVARDRIAVTTKSIPKGCSSILPTVQGLRCACPRLPSRIPSGCLTPNSLAAECNFVAVGTRLQNEEQQIFLVESDIDILKIAERPNEQSGADQQQQRHRDLRYDQGFAQS
jgi:hypothetical protein